MADQYAIAGLVRKRAELADELKIVEARLAWLQDSLAHIDAALRLIDSNSSPVRITQITNAVRLFRIGYMSRFILSTLRVRGPMDREALTLALMLDAGLDLNDKLLRSEVSRRLRYSLRDQAKMGRIKREQGQGQDMLWAIER
ncbi:MAG: hypothetical protein O2967_00680 [Proteobacteria bacterium]|nr:hypothetical protein [Pseudomonadota bacterium]